MIEELDDILEYIADRAGVYGAHDEEVEGDDGCRICFTENLRTRLEAVFARKSNEDDPLLREQLASLQRDIKGLREELHVASWPKHQTDGNPVDLTIALLEADALVEGVLEKYREGWDDPEREFVQECYRKRIEKWVEERNGRSNTSSRSGSSGDGEAS